jgi:hypothetical protein
MILALVHITPIIERSPEAATPSLAGSRHAVARGDGAPRTSAGDKQRRGAHGETRQQRAVQPVVAAERLGSHEPTGGRVELRYRRLLRIGEPELSDACALVELPLRPDVVVTGRG